MFLHVAVCVDDRPYRVSGEGVRDEAVDDIVGFERVREEGEEFDGSYVGIWGEGKVWMRDIRSEPCCVLVGGVCHALGRLRSGGGVSDVEGAEVVTRVNSL